MPSERGRKYLEIRSLDGVSAAYDYIAQEFRHDTGLMAPGKDVPYAMGGGDWQASMEAFHLWRKKNGCYPIIPMKGGTDAE